MEKERGGDVGRWWGGRDRGRGRRWEKKSKSVGEKKKEMGGGKKTRVLELQC